MTAGFIDFSIQSWASIGQLRQVRQFCRKRTGLCQSSVVFPTISNRIFIEGIGYRRSRIHRFCRMPTSCVDTKCIGCQCRQAHLCRKPSVTNPSQMINGMHFSKQISAIARKWRRFLPATSRLPVIHLAAESHVDRSITGADAFLETNVMGTYRLLEVTKSYHAAPEPDARARFRFVHVLTDEVYRLARLEGTLPE